MSRAAPDLGHNATRQQPCTLALALSAATPRQHAQARHDGYFQEPCHEAKSQQPKGFQDVAWLLPWLHSKTTPTAHDQQAAASGRSIKPHRQHSKTTLTVSRSPDASHWMRCLTLRKLGGLANATTARPPRKPPKPWPPCALPLASVRLTKPSSRCAEMPSFPRPVTR